MRPAALLVCGLLLAVRPTCAELIKGVSYGPVPLKSVDGASSLSGDDWFCDEAVPMWGRSGRGDLRIMKQLGANMVRLYGNTAENDHTNFLDEAQAEGLRVAAGMSDWPYYQKVPGNCLRDTNLNCFTQIKPLYALNLRNGFLRPDGTYHPALKYMNILNEPDLKVPPGADNGGPDGPVQMGRALISAFDALLDAEAEAGVTGPLINFTATFSYAICSSCSTFNNKPALGQMAQLHDAMHNPEKYGYTPKHDITAAYKARFTHSFNTQNPATDLQHQFLDDYTTYFPTTPVYIGEYHRAHANQTDDLGTILSLAEQNPLFLGISFFQYQVAYWKAGSERDFGMFGLGSRTLVEMNYFGKTYNVYCLEAQPSAPSGMVMPSAVAHIYGGSDVDYSALCLPSPEAVPLNLTGYHEILSQRSVSQMAGFIERFIHHLGATVSADARGTLQMFAQGFVDGTSGGFEEMASKLGGSRPSWINFDEYARCVADRNVQPSVIAKAIGWACMQATSFACDDIPSPCASNTYRVADYIFSRLYKELDAVNPLVDCSFQGAAIFASSELYGRWTGSSQCVDGGASIPTSTAPAGGGEATTSADASGSGSASVTETSRSGGHHDFPEGDTMTMTTTGSAKFLMSAASRPRLVSWQFCSLALLHLLLLVLPAVTVAPFGV